MDAPVDYDLEDEEDPEPSPGVMAQPRGYHGGSPFTPVSKQEDPLETTSPPAQSKEHELEVGNETAPDPSSGTAGPSELAKERYVIITTPSGFKTRYIVKSYNRYARGKTVFSQTTYIPLDPQQPLTPDVNSGDSKQ